jgi:crotonobetaine/carnitine-CoA ligase
MVQPDVVPALLAERARTSPETLFVECAGVRRTFAQMHERTERLASGLASLGVSKGDRVASILPNAIEHVDLIFACARLGAIHVPVNVFLKGDFLAYQLADAAASVVVGDTEGLLALEPIREQLRDLEHAISSDDLPTDDADVPDAGIEPSDTVAIMYTSGTTGMPKGCMLPHGYHAMAPRFANTMLEYAKGDVLYTALPLFHGWARGMLFGALVHDLTV